MCPACYQRWHRGSPAVDSACCVCGLDDGRVLRAVKLGDGTTVTACQNHGWLIERARPRLLSVQEAVELCAVPGDRRRPDGDRRQASRRSACSLPYDGAELRALAVLTDAQPHG